MREKFLHASPRATHEVFCQTSQLKMEQLVIWFFCCECKKYYFLLDLDVMYIKFYPLFQGRVQVLYKSTILFRHILFDSWHVTHSWIQHFWAERYKKDIFFNPCHEYDCYGTSFFNGKEDDDHSISESNWSIKNKPIKNTCL